MKTNYVDPFPLPKVVAASDEKRISNLVRALIAEKAGVARPDRVAKYENEIDNAVFELYKFDDEAMAVVGRALSAYATAQTAGVEAIEVVKQ